MIIMYYLELTPKSYEYNHEYFMNVSFFFSENFIVEVIHFSFAQILEKLNMLRVWEMLSFDSLP
jgi:hypothetical protein